MTRKQFEAVKASLLEFIGAYCKEHEFTYEFAAGADGSCMVTIRKGHGFFGSLRIKLCRGNGEIVLNTQLNTISHNVHLSDTPPAATDYHAAAKAIYDELVRLMNPSQKRSLQPQSSEAQPNE